MSSDTINGWRVIGTFLTASGRRKLTDSYCAITKDKDEAIELFTWAQTVFVKKTLIIVDCVYGPMSPIDILIAN